MDPLYYQHQERTPFPEGSRLPEMDSQVERLVHYAELTGRLLESSNRNSQYVRELKEKLTSLERKFSDSQYNSERYREQLQARNEEIAELNAVIAKLEKKLPKKPAKKTVKKAKK